VELITKNLELGSMDLLGQSSTKVDMRVELKSAAKRIVSINSRCHVTETARTDAEVRITGRVVTRVIYLDESDAWQGEEGSTTFTEKLILKNSEFIAGIHATTEIVDSRIVDTGNPSSVDIVSNISVNLIGITKKEIAYVAGLQGEVESRCDSTKITSFSNILEHNFELEERFDLDKTCLGVLGVDLSAALKEVIVLDGKLSLKGLASVNMIAVKSADEQHIIYNENQEFDFSKSMTVSGLSMNDIVSAHLVVTETQMRLENKGKAELVISASVRFTAHVATVKTVEFVSDAFGFENKLGFTHNTVEGAIAITHVTQTEVEGNLTMPDSTPYITKILAAEGARILSATLTPASDKVTIDGKLGTTVIYECEERGIHAHNAILPFSSSIKMTGTTKEAGVSASVALLTCRVKARRGRELLIDARVGLSLTSATTEMHEITGNVVLGEQIARDQSSIMIYTVGDSETLWDIAKRIGTKIVDILKQNPSLSNGINPGDKVFIYRQEIINF